MNSSNNTPPPRMRQAIKFEPSTNELFSNAFKAAGITEPSYTLMRNNLYWVQNYQDTDEKTITPTDGYLVDIHSFVANYNLIQKLKSGWIIIELKNDFEETNLPIIK